MEPIKWKKSPHNFYKLNWDTATDQNKGKISIWAVLRNSDGLVIGTIRISQPYLRNSFIVEALGLFYASKFCKDIGITQLILEGDALQVIQILKSTHSDWSQLAWLSMMQKTSSTHLPIGLVHVWSDKAIKWPTY